MKKITTKFQAVLTNAYTSQNGDDPRATGGVTLVELRRGRSGILYRLTDDNGCYQSSGPSRLISQEQADEILARAAAREENDRRNGR